MERGVKRAGERLHESEREKERDKGVCDVSVSASRSCVLVRFPARA